MTRPEAPMLALPALAATTWFPVRPLQGPRALLAALPLSVPIAPSRA